VTATLGLPVIVAGILTYGRRSTAALTGDTTVRSLWWITGLAAATFALTLLAWFGSWVTERRRLIWESPWDMTTFEDNKAPKVHKLFACRNFLEAMQLGHFDTPAVGVASAEGWHRVYAWDDEKQRQAVNHLEEMRLRFHAERTVVGACLSSPSSCQSRAEPCAALSRRRGADR
jgi:hypothetical protein